MIFKQIKFQVVYKVGEDFHREDISELLCNPEFGVTSIKTVTGFELAYDPLSTALFQFTGQFDQKGAQIYHGDLLADAEGEMYEVVSYYGGYHLKQISSERMYILSDEVCMKLQVIGDAMRHASLLMPADPEAVMKASTERRILPPLVTLKKKQV